ncbi:hypothetical protein H0H93_006634, partial [Arthromyces matolae]
MVFTSSFMTQDLQPRHPPPSMSTECYFVQQPISKLRSSMLVKVPSGYLHSADRDKLEPMVTVLVLKTDVVNKHGTMIQVAVLDTKAQSQHFRGLETLDQWFMEINKITAQLGNPMTYISLEAGCMLDQRLNVDTMLDVYWKHNNPILLEFWAKEVLRLQPLAVEPPFLWTLAYDQIPSGTLGEVSPKFLSDECFDSPQQQSTEEDTGNAMSVVFLTDIHHEKPLQVAFFTKDTTGFGSVSLSELKLQELVSSATHKLLFNVFLIQNCRLKVQLPNISVKVYCIMQDSHHYPSLDVEPATWSESNKKSEPEVIKIEADQVEKMAK